MCERGGTGDTKPKIININNKIEERNDREKRNRTSSIVQSLAVTSWAEIVDNAIALVVYTVCVKKLARGKYQNTKTATQRPAQHSSVHDKDGMAMYLKLRL